MHVRKAHLDDIPWIMGELRQFSTTYKTKKSLFGNEDYARTGLTSLIQNHLALLAAHESGEPAGLIVGLVTPHFFNPEIRTLAEIFWWVSEKSRGSRAGYLLLKEFMEWGKKNVDWVTVALEEHTPVSGNALTKRGFVLTEKAFLLEVA